MSNRNMRRPREAGFTANRIDIVVVATILIIIVVAWMRFSRSADAPPAIPIGAPVTIEAPLGLPPVPIPEDNPPTMETIALGKRLYFDPALSADDTVSCATCHHPDFGFTDGQAVSTGVAGFWVVRIATGDDDFRIFGRGVHCLSFSVISRKVGQKYFQTSAKHTPNTA